MEIERFFAELASGLGAAPQRDCNKYHRFFAELAPRLDTARALESELDRQLARRFNVLDYLSTDELGLSRIIADLLDPNGPHGQGTLFLERFVDSLGGLRFRPDIRASRISVVVEKVIPKNRRIDIYITFSVGETVHCLAIENKPYAEDQKNQVKDYLEHLSGQFGERFVLIYLSPNGQGPSNWSIPESELPNWKRRFAILSYCTVDSERGDDSNGDQSDRLEEYRLPSTLADWIGECRRTCEVDRLKWFLCDTEVFCQRIFGDRIMATDSETNAVKDCLLSNPQNLAIASTVYESWPEIREDICKKFFDQLCRSVEREAREKMPQFANDMRVGYRYWGERRLLRCLWLYRLSWTQYDVTRWNSEGRTAIFLAVNERRPNGWSYGVGCPQSEEKLRGHDRERRLQLNARLEKVLGVGRQGRWWPWWNRVDRRYRNWDNLVAALYRECSEEGGGEVMKYFVTRVVDAAERAFPIINEIEGVDA